MTTVSPLFGNLTCTARPGSNSTTSIADDFSTFLNLLTVQLQNQDPLEPLDTNQFTEQIVNMTQVEQTVSMNSRLGALIDAQETARIQSAVQFVGKQADAIGDIVPLGADGAEMFYNLPSLAGDVEVAIIDPSATRAENRVIKRFEDPSGAIGLHRVSWDGIGDNGQPVDPSKTYRLSVVAKSEDGGDIAATIGFSGIAEELRNTDGALMLSVGGIPVSLDDIVAARVPSVKTTPAS